MKIPVGILGASGLIGQNYLAMLQDHPWFEIGCLATSKTRSHEKSVDPSQFMMKNYPVSSLEDFPHLPIIFSALPDLIAAKIEKQLANQGSWVISSASYHRKTHPMIIPEINPHHIQGNHLITKPNCAIQSFLLPLAPLHKIAQIRSLAVTTLQATSGTGYPGIAFSKIHDNILPYIEGEEEKIESEPLKILEADFPISAHCNRVPIFHGHMVCVSVSFNKQLTFDEILSIWHQPSSLHLPSAPKFPIVYHHSPERPQPQLDRDYEKGMGVSIGRLRSCPLLDWRFTALSHNAIRGGAGNGILIAEYLKEAGYLG
ncbi:MAG: aspartate-semialdehyde dehydrogenase [Chlamydiales bacterium]